MDKMLNLSALRFLVVDNNHYMCANTKSILRILGARERETVYDAEAAFTLQKAFIADIIITDWQMEPLNGIKLTHMIRTSKDSPNHMVPIIMMSAYSERSRVTQARDAGVTEFVTKPVSPKSLYLRIAEVVLKPRQFVRTTTFFGPDRQRHQEDNNLGPQRRQLDKQNS